MIKHLTVKNHFSTFLTSESFDRSRRYRLSAFTIVDDLGADTLVFNTMTSQLLAVPSVLWRRISKCCYDYQDDECDDVAELVNLHFLVPQDCDESERYEELLHLAKSLSFSTTINRYNILTTTACNAKCFYCFEQGVVPVTMNTDTAMAVVKYIVDTHDQTKPIHLRWFGGEPLVNSKVIDLICAELGKNGVEYYSTISTNGILLNPSLIEDKYIALWKLKRIRLSLDGYGAEHDKRKGFDTQGDIFKKTIYNAQEISAKGLLVNIRLTVDKDNIEMMGELAQWLVQVFEGNPNISIYTRCIFMAVSTEVASKDQKAVEALVASVERIDDFLFHKHLYDIDRIAPIGFQPYFCAANSPHAVVINPEGKLCSCESVVAETRYWGNVWSGETDKKLHKEWLECNIRDKCKACPFLPVCTPFNKCCIDYFDCKYKQTYLHKWYMRNVWNKKL